MAKVIFKSLKDLEKSLAENGIEGSPIEKMFLGTINPDLLGDVQTNNGRKFFQVGEFRLLTKTATPTGEVSIIKALRAFGKMTEGQQFAVVE